jgi:hypothetical protein
VSRRQGGGDEGVEASGEGGVVWRRSATAAGRRETSSPTDRHRDSDARGGGCMRGVWSRRGSVEPAAGGRPTARQCTAMAAVRAACGRKTRARSETDSVGTVALGRAQFGAQCCFAIIQTLLTVQNTK